MDEHEQAGHGRTFSAEETATIRLQVSAWWEQRRELRPDSAWDVPFPPLEGHTARVTLEHDEADPAGDGLWRAALIRPQARSAFIEVESREGPLPALINLYQHMQ